MAEKARTEAAATSAAASAAAVRVDRLILITIFREVAVVSFMTSHQAATLLACVISPTGMPG
jgi:hypothetical protein